MSKYPTYPPLYDNVIQLSITNLKKWGYLKPKQIKAGKVTWSSADEETSSIAIRVNTASFIPFLTLDYRYLQKDIRYNINFVSVTSNLNRGKIWYFVCPETGKQCRKLYMIDGNFLHRDAFTGGMYESQTKSKYYRSLEKALGSEYLIDELNESLFSRKLRKTYAGKPTKKYLKIQEKIEKIETASFFALRTILDSDHYD